MEYSANYRPPVVDLPEGRLEGLNLGKSLCFLGVPYARAGRFERPLPPQHWNGVRSAQAYGPVCPIQNPDDVSPNAYAWPRRYWVENENCLNLNIWTPSINPAAGKSVLVFFHGGGYTNGSAIEGLDYDGKNLCEYGDVVVVTVNHRLNVIGCLDLSAYGQGYKDTANLTLMDLVASLKWIHRSIQAFGGDPEHVTLFGQSGGSSKVASMYYIPEADGLYHSAFALSYGAPWSMNQGDSADVAALTLKKLGIEPSEADKLRTVPYYALIRAGDQACAELSEEKGYKVWWAPTYDEKFFHTRMTEYGKGRPYVCGSVFSEFEGTLHRHERKNKWTEEYVSRRLTEAYGSDQDTVNTEFARLFPNKKPQDVLFYNNRWGGFLIGSSVHDAVRQAASQSNSNIYHYLFSYEIPVNGGLTAFHGSELHFIFHNIDMPDIFLATGGTAACHRLQDILASSLIRLAKTGNPSPEGITWKPWAEEKQETMIFDSQCECKEFDDEKLCRLLMKHADQQDEIHRKVVI